jgi:glycosyltransferase involved in cell wall biosynthesis
MMHITHILWSAHFGGIERLVLDLAKVQSYSSETQVSVLFGRGEGEMLEYYRDAKLAFRSLDLRNGFYASPKKIKALERFFSTQDILHFHGFIPVIARTATTSTAHIVYTEHGNFGFGRNKTMRDMLKRILLKRFLNHHVDYISFNSHFTRKIAEKRYDLRDVERDVIYNGIDFISRRSPKADVTHDIRNRIEGKFVVGTSSRFVGFKRIDRLIKAFAQFGKGKDTVLLLVGDGPLRRNLSALAISQNLADRTIFAGYQAEIRSYQDAMDVCVFPSQYEPFGLVAIETLSIGKPTIVMQDGGGLAEIVGGYSPEDVVSDVVQLARRLEHYYGHRDITMKDAEARALYAQQFGIADMAKSFANIYEKLRKCAV